MLNQEQILLTLYDMALTIGAEDRVKPLAENTLRRLIYHTGYPCGLFLLNVNVGQDMNPPQQERMLTLYAAIGDYRLPPYIGLPLNFPAPLVDGPAAQLQLEAGLLERLPLRPDHYTHALRLPIPGDGVIVLLSAGPPRQNIPFHNIFHPVMANLAKGLRLCRNNEAYTGALISDRDQARLAHKRFRSALDTSADCVFLIDPEAMGFVDFNQAATALLGYAPDELLSMGPQHITPEYRSHKLREIFQSLLGQEGNDWFELTTVHRKKNGELFPVEVRFNVLHQPHRESLIIAVARDITERKQAEERLFEQQERALVTLHSIGDGVITTDPQGRIEFINPVAEALTGWRTAEVQGRPLTEVFRIVNESTREPVTNPVEKCLKENRTVGLANHTVLIDRWGEEIAIEDSAAPIRNRRGEIIGVVLVFHDVTGTRNMARELAWQASHDSLTGLTNRREFEQRLETAFAQARSGDRTHTLLYIDLDNFKVVNDTCGHIAGDNLLQQLAFHLQQQLTDSDTIARLGGDEFGILLHDHTIDLGRQVAERLRERASEFSFVWEGKIFTVGTSIGAVEINATMAGPAQILSNADVACYAAKDHGGNRIHLYQPNDSELAERHGEMHWVSRIGHALDQNRLTLYAQPIRPLLPTDDHRHHFELLLRMHDEAGRLTLPGAFIPAAERYNLMPAIDRWVIREALTRYKEQRDHAADIVFTVNLSGSSLTQDGLLEYIQEQFRQSGVPPANFCFEVTETAAIAHIGRAQRLIRELRTMGCAFALDDFGSGLSSFAYLKNLPVDFLKIDGGFVKDMLDDPFDATMVAAIHRIGHDLGLMTIAEFVENEQILERLREIGVDYVQGYGIGHPRPLNELYDETSLTSRAMMTASSRPLAEG